MESVRESIAGLDLVQPIPKLPAGPSKPTKEIKGKGKRRATASPEVEGPTKKQSAGPSKKPSTKKARKGEASTSAVLVEDLPPLPSDFQQPSRRVKNVQAEILKLRLRLLEGQQLVPNTVSPAARLTLDQVRLALAGSSATPLVSNVFSFLLFSFLIFY
jgi:hypothetical protein